MNERTENDEAILVADIDPSEEKEVINLARNHWAKRYGIARTHEGRQPRLDKNSKKKAHAAFAVDAKSAWMNN